ncbi:hypothetical protein KKH65_02420 [bacterium]|nr:hypothetical protein [bacterium]MBU2461713.1 hypothetical protein [bacterium]
MKFLLRFSTLLAIFLLIVEGWVLIMIGFGAISPSKFFLFLEGTNGLGIGIGSIIIAFLCFFFDKRYFTEEKGIEIEGKFGNVLITKKAISDLIEGMVNLEGIYSVLPNISIKNGKLLVKVEVMVAANQKMDILGAKINENLAYLLEEVLSIKDYKKKVSIKGIKRRRAF